MANSTDVFKRGFESAIKGTTNVDSEVFREIDKVVRNLKEDDLEGGLSDGKSLKDLAKKHKVDIEELKKQLEMGIDVEKKEHIKKKKSAEEIAMDHLFEDPKYYTKLKKMETSESKVNKLSKDSHEMVSGVVNIINQIKDVKNKKQIAQNMLKQFKREKIEIDSKEFLKMCKLSNGEKKETKEATGTGSSGAYSAPLFSGEEPKKVEAKEATGSGSVGAYETPAVWAKSTKSKDWRGKSKTQIPGGAFVTVKKKCKSFPYCNQGDIKSLKIYERREVKNAIENVARKLNISETVIKAIIQHELEKNGNH